MNAIIVQFAVMWQSEHSPLVATWLAGFDDARTMPLCEWQLEHAELVGPKVPRTWQPSQVTLVCDPSRMKPVLK
jgi:hypothetical protein